MQIEYQPFMVHKRFPLTISRGTTTHNTNLWLKIRADNVEGWGEATPFSISKQGGLTTPKLIQELEAIVPLLEPFHPLQRAAIYQILQQHSVSSALRAAIDTALQDWLGKQAGLPLWQLWGLDRSAIVKTSVTIGISTPEAAIARVRQWQDFMGATVFKLKLGSPSGLDADRAMFEAVQAVAPDAEFTVDANGGWTLAEAIAMADWLAERGVRHLEQPLPVAAEADYPTLYAQSPLPLFADESCFSSADVVRVAPWVHGVNIKLMKAGGLMEAQRMIHTAQALGLQIMYGCYSDSALANTALSQLAPYADYLDLDSHLNLVDDPFVGAQLNQGCLWPNDGPGLGVSLA
ncbi:MAG: dipeptide epimerase [Spirulina sp. SIO3F2]|nr:dipeptide epimerase [Spirulina sp. SIO3F2]